MCNGPVVGSWKPSVAGAREEEGAGQVNLSYLGRGWRWRGSRGRFCVRGADVTGALKRLSISRCTVSLTGPGPDFGRIRLLSPPPPSEDAWQTRRMAQVAWRPASAAQRLRTWFLLLPPAVPTLASPQVRQPMGSSRICFLVHRQGLPPPPLPLKRQCRTPTFHPPPLPSGVTCQGQCRRTYTQPFRGRSSSLYRT